MKHTVKEYMTRKPVVVAPDATVQEAAGLMRKADCGILPVGTVEDPVGMITDRDIVTRGVADNKPAQTKVRELMTRQVYSVAEDDNIKVAADLMVEHEVTRLMVTNARGKVTGILSMGHLIRNAEPALLAKLVERSVGKKAA